MFTLRLSVSLLRVASDNIITYQFKQITKPAFKDVSQDCSYVADNETDLFLHRRTGIGLRVLVVFVSMLSSYGWNCSDHDTGGGWLVPVAQRTRPKGSAQMTQERVSILQQFRFHI